MRRVLRAGAFLLAILVSAEPCAQSLYTGNIYELALFDYPDNLAHGLTCPSMYQSAALTKNLYTAANELLMPTPKEYRLIIQIAYLFTDSYLVTYLPGARAWTHEEGHRAVLAQYGINSYNEVYDLNIGTDSISVSHVKDAKLADFKRKHPADMVRLGEAGIEAEYQWIKRSREDYFFSGKIPDFEHLSWFASALNSSIYIYICTTSEADTRTEAYNRDEKTQNQRDLIGLDFTAWVYDLYRPDEPYEKRGRHELGDGYDRYIKHSDLTAEERSYLKQHFYLSLINLVSPQLYSINSFDNGRMRWNFALSHNLTSFGGSSEFHLLSAFKGYNLVTVMRLYHNESLYLPGAEMALRRYKFSSIPLLFDAYAAIWLQPRDQMFHEKNFTPGIASEIKCAYPLGGTFEIYTSIRAKSEGWLAGEVSLKQMAGFRLGVQSLL